MKKTRPNDPCPCGSGTKYKKCCGPKEAPAAPGFLSRRLFGRSRLCKGPAEIEGMRRAGRFNALAMEYVRPFVRAGVSTGELDRLVHEFTVKSGHQPATLKYRGFPRSICTSVNSVVCHGIPRDDEILRDGDIVNVDLTSIVDGFHGDVSETFLVGDVAPDGRKIAAVARECLRLGIAAVRPGATLLAIGEAIEGHAESEGCSVVRDYTGHGIGRRFHEDPQVLHYRSPESRKFVLEPGMTFTVEPMVNLGGWQTRVLEDRWTAVTADGSLSAQYEHTVLVTETGVEVLTAGTGG